MFGDDYEPRSEGDARWAETVRRCSAACEEAKRKADDHRRLYEASQAEVERLRALMRRQTQLNTEAIRDAEKAEAEMAALREACAASHDAYVRHLQAAALKQGEQGPASGGTVVDFGEGYTGPRVSAPPPTIATLAAEMERVKAAVRLLADDSAVRGGFWPRDAVRKALDGEG